MGQRALGVLFVPLAPIEATTVTVLDADHLVTIDPGVPTTWRRIGVGRRDLARQAGGMKSTVPYIGDSGSNPTMLAALRDSMPDTHVAPVDELDDGQRAVATAVVLDGLDADQLARLPALEMVQTTWAGVEAVLAVVPGHVHVVRMIDPQLGRTMAEAVLAWTLYLHRDMPRYLRQQRNGEWIEHGQVLARERRVGILGLGALGALAATTLSDQGFDVAGWSRSPKTIDGVASFHGDDGFDAVLERSDIVVNLLPHTPATAGLLDADAFGRLPDGASLINVGRGATVDDDALLAALDAASSPRLDHAVLDVFHAEPLPEGHPFWNHPGVTVMPHIAANTTPASAASVAAANVVAYLADGSLPADALVDRARGY